MAVGLIKEKWVHSSKNSPNRGKKSPVRAWWNRQKKKNEKAIEDAQIKMKQSKDRLQDGKDSFTKQLDNIKKEGRLTTKKSFPSEAIEKGD